MNFSATDVDTRAITAAKVLAADAVEAAGNGHPGTPISLAAAAYLMYQYVMDTDPTDPTWPGRDRFVLSAGHASALQYVQLYLAGFDVSLDDLKHFRARDAKLTGHPELGRTAGVEITTGPLGTGVAAAVGMAMEARRVRGLMDASAPAGESPFDHMVYVVTGDGCLQEGSAYEAISLAGTQNLGNLVLLYDENRISIEDDIDIAFTEDVAARFSACGWHVQELSWLAQDGSYHEDIAALAQAFANAKAETNRPSLIKLRTIIGWPTPNKQNIGGVHGSPLGNDEIRALKRVLGYDPDATFDVDADLVKACQTHSLQRAAATREAWNQRFEAWRQAHPTEAKLWQRLQEGKLPADLEALLPAFEPGKAIATRKASHITINALAPALPELWGGSADLAGSNLTDIKGELSFAPPERSTKAWEVSPYGRNLHFGVREHAMAGIANGIASSGLTRPYVATFFVFSDFMRGAARLSALMNLPVTYVWTHDSVGVGEDGPTHQPIETLTAWRAMPNFSVVRPADAEETAYAWLEVLRRRGPAGLVLSRQGIPNPGHAESGLAPASEIAKGGYVLKDFGASVELILLASGSEVALALSAAEQLAAEHIGVRVVSMPCLEWFEQQDVAYRESVLPPSVSARVSIEAGIAMPWRKYVTDRGASISSETFGVPMSGSEAFAHFGFTTDNIIATAHKVLKA